MNIYFTSDTHYHHKNIVRGTSDWEEKSRCRDFNTLEEHDKVIVDNINAVVKEDDILIHLGDWSFGGIENIWNFRKQLNCKNINLILGNHDHHILNNRSFIIPEKDTELYEKLFDERMGSDESQRTIRLKSLFRKVTKVDNCSYTMENKHFNEMLSPQRSFKYDFFLSHYAHRVWDSSHKGVFHLYAHSHATLEDKPYGKSMDVGIDNAYRIFKEYKPFHLNEIINILDKREILLIDHHSHNTN